MKSKLPSKYIKPYLGDYVFASKSLIMIVETVRQT